MLHSWCLFIGFNDSSSCSFVNSGGCQTLTLDNGCWLPPTTHHCSLLLWQCQGAANAAPTALFDSHMAAIFFDNGSHIIGNIPTNFTKCKSCLARYKPNGFKIILNGWVWLGEKVETWCKSCSRATKISQSTVRWVYRTCIRLLASGWGKFHRI
jgi:hypothetical protein